jgi:hypothetical protein
MTGVTIAYESDIAIECDRRFPLRRFRRRPAARRAKQEWNLTLANPRLHALHFPASPDRLDAARARALGVDLEPTGY